jgi:steroid delta-isomerase-like uncharacterized protein
MEAFLANHTREQLLHEVAHQLLHTFNRHDAWALAQLYAEGQVTTCSGEAEPVSGRDALSDFAARVYRAFPDVHLEPSSILYAGEDHIVLEVVATGTHWGPMATLRGVVPPTGRHFATPSVSIVRIDASGLVAEQRTSLDTADVDRQLGFHL